jgi:hypothetical protein
MGRVPNQGFRSIGAACSALLERSEEGALNIRSFKPGATKGNPLLTNIKSAAEAESAIAGLSNNGFFTIANEVIPINDGGVSGVVVGNVFEFAPDDTPKCVDAAGVASLPKAEGMRMIEHVYGFRPRLEYDQDLRVEFSVHPMRRGFRREHTIIWEVEHTPIVREASIGKWPNRFSKHIGDKAYGLLIAHVLGLSVPQTLVVGRRVAPFTFGQRTGTLETWIRTCPRTPLAGKYPTAFGWEDPFAMLCQCDPQGEMLASVLAQESVDFVYSGAALTAETGVIIEGKLGRGDAFMLGEAASVQLPVPVQDAVTAVHKSITQRLRSVKFEWVWDGDRVWVVQLHRRAKGISRAIVYAGNPEKYVTFRTEDGLERLRDLIADLVGKNIGVVLAGDVGVTSHLGDLLREARIPSTVESHEPESSLA